MTTTRRNNDRRRRVLYCAQQSEGTESSAAARREFRKLREARRPTALYAERVQRRLQGRWFSLVPIQMRTFAIVASCSVAITVFLVVLQYIALTWPPLAYREEIARPLRLDHPGSFGRWYLSFLLAGIAGVSLMIYQLRRYRIDDYLGHYRLWRLVLITFAIASVGVAVSLVSWTGSLLDLAFGKRVALVGADWIRLLVSIGGGILALRMIAEIYRYRIALAGVLTGIGFILIPEAAGWNLFVVSSPFLAAAPLLATTAWWVGLGGYLRSLHREVCEVEASPTLRERIGKLNLGILRKEQVDDLEEQDPQQEAEVETGEQKRRWWQRRQREAADEFQDAEAETEAKTPREESEPSPPPKKKRRFGLGLRLQPPQATDDTNAEEEPAETATQDEDSNADAEETPAKKRRGRGLGGFLKRRKTEEPEASASESAESESPVADDALASDEAASVPSNEDYIDPDSIDWNGLSKAERRRLRKQLKRQTRAA